MTVTFPAPASVQPPAPSPEPGAALPSAAPPAGQVPSTGAPDIPPAPMPATAPEVDLPPPAPASPQALAALEDHLSLMDSSAIGVDIAALLALFAEFAQTLRNSARIDRQAALQDELNRLVSAAEKLESAAAQRFLAAVIQGAMQIAGGALQLGLSGASLRGSIKGAYKEYQADRTLQWSANGPAKGMGPAQSQALREMGRDLELQGKKLSANGVMMTSAGQAATPIAGGIGGIAAAFFNNKADLEEADRAKEEALAKMDEQAVAEANEIMQQMLDVIRDILQKLQAMEQATAQTNSGIARNI